MQGLFRQGAFQGTTPREAYFVSCDRRPTTQNDIDRGIVNIIVGFAPLKPAEFVVIEHPADRRVGDGLTAEEGQRWPSSPSTPTRFDPYKNFKFRVKWDGRYVAGVSKVGVLKRTTEVVQAPRRRRPEQQPQVARAAPSTRPITLERGVTHDVDVRAVGEQGVELRLRPRRRDVARGLPQGHHPRGLQRGRPARDRLQGLPLLGLGVPGAARSRRQRQRRGDPDTSSSRTRAGSATTRSASRRSRPSPSRDADADPRRRGGPAGGVGGGVGRPRLRRRRDAAAPVRAGRRPRRRAGPAAGHVDRGGRAALRRGLRRRRGRGRRLPRLRGDAGGRAASGRFDSAAGAARDGSRRGAGRREGLVVRCPTSRDLLAAAASADPTATLLARCVTDAGGTAVDPASLAGPRRAAVDAAAERLAGAAAVVLRAGCPACGGEVRVDVDVTGAGVATDLPGGARCPGGGGRAVARHSAGARPTSSR